MKTRYMRGANPLPDKSKDKSTHSIELSDANYDLYTSSRYFTNTRVKTAAELTASDKEDSKKSIESTRQEKFQEIKIKIQLLKELSEDMEILGLSSTKWVNGEGVKTYTLAQIKARLKVLVQLRHDARTKYITDLEAL